MAQPRHTARGLVVHDGQLLLMERWRDDKHYFSVPGGGIEAGETPAETVVREILEETGCHVAVDRQLYIMHTGDVDHSIFLCKYISGEPQLQPDSEEAIDNAAGQNRFNPRWVSLHELAELPFLIWRPIQQRFLHDLAHGFPPETVEIMAEPLH